MRSLLLILLAGVALGEPRPIGERRGAKLPESAFATDRPPAQGMMNLQKRKYRIAASIFKQALMVRPDAYGTQTLLGQAYAGMHDCERALPLLVPNVARKAFSADAALLMSRCYDRVGNIGESIYWAEQAAVLEPVRPDVQVGLAWYKFVGHEPGAREQIDYALSLDPENPSVIATRGLLALHVGDVDAAEEAIAELKAVPGRRLSMSFFLDALLELDLGNAVRAELLFARSFWRDKSYVPTMVYWGEAARRQGNHQECLYVLDSVGAPGLTVREDYTRAIRARAEVDRGALAAARRLVDEALAIDPVDVEAVASAWYLARAEGDEASAAEWAERYALVNASPLRTLEQLIPLGQYPPE